MFLGSRMLDSRDNYPHSPLGDKEPNIPTGREVEWEPLVDYRRNGVSDIFLLP